MILEAESDPGASLQGVVTDVLESLTYHLAQHPTKYATRALFHAFWNPPTSKSMKRAEGKRSTSRGLSRKL